MAKNNTTQPVVIEHDEKTEHKPIALADFKIIDKDGDGYTMTDILDEAVSTQQVHDAAETASNNLQLHLVMMAAKCVKPEVFRALCELAEADKKWGKAPAGSPAHIRNQYTATPPTYSQYKSKILRAMEAGIVPMAEVELKRKLRKPDAQGATFKLENVKLDSVRKMMAAREQTELQSEGEGVTAGVVVTAKGEQKLVGKGTNTTDLEQARIKAGVVDMELASIFSELTDVFIDAPKEEQDKAVKTLKRLIGRLKASHDETVKQAHAATA